MDIALWIAAGLLAAVLLVGGLSKLVMPKDRIAGFRAGRWVDDFSPGAIKALGVLDIAAAVGLTLPAVLDVAPVVVPLAASGVILLMGGAVVVRLRCRLIATIVPDLVYLFMAAFVAWGRLGPEPF
jgi:hypothetical protein